MLSGFLVISRAAKPLSYPQNTARAGAGPFLAEQHSRARRSGQFPAGLHHTTNQGKQNVLFQASFFFSPNQTNQGVVLPRFWFGFVLKHSKTTLQQSWLSNHPACQRTNDPGSRAEQAPRQQERSQRFGITGALPAELLPTATETQNNSVTLGLLCRAARPTAAQDILVPPGQDQLLRQEPDPTLAKPEISF